MSTSKNSNLSVPKNVITNVHTNVHMNGELSETRPTAEKRPKVRHLSLLEKSWVYQRRLPRRLTKDQVASIFRKRVGVLSVPKARIAAASIDRLVDGLIYAAEQGLKRIMDLNGLAMEIDEPVRAFMLTKMEDAFQQGVEKLLDEGFSNPEQESNVIAACLAKFRADTAEFNRSAFRQFPEGNVLHDAMWAKAKTTIGAYDRSLNNAELNLRGVHGRSFEELAEAMSKTPTGGAVIEAGMAAFLEAVFESEEFAAYQAQFNSTKARKLAEEAIREVLVRQQEKASEWPKGKIQTPTEASPDVESKSKFSFDELNQPAAKRSDSKSAFAEGGDESDLNRAHDVIPETQVPFFLGRLDQKFIKRPVSIIRLFSTALADYVGAREKELKLDIGATLPPELRAQIPSLAGKKFPTPLTRDLGTLRSRAAVFIELIGDHPLDCYTKSDIEFFIHCLRYLPPKASPKNIRDAGGLRPFLETQVDILSNDPIGPAMAAATIENGFLAGIRPIFRNNPLEDRMIDPIGLIGNDYKKLFGKSQTREHFGDASMRDIVKEGLARKSLAFTFLPILGVITSRRLSALTGLKGNDIELAYTAYDDNENNVYAAKTNAWLDGDGATVDPSMKTEVSKAHFVLHSTLEEIGFTKWAKSLDEEHIFKSFQSAADHESYASKVMGRFLSMMGAKPNQVFHSFRHQGIQHLRDELGIVNAARHQAGHTQDDEHEKYGSSILPEKSARKVANMELPRWLKDVLPELKKVNFAEFRMNDVRGATRLGKQPKPRIGLK